MCFVDILLHEQIISFGKVVQHNKSYNDDVPFTLVDAALLWLFLNLI